MERKPEHLVVDPALRLEYIGQQSFDEYCTQEGYIFFQEGWQEELVGRGMNPDDAFKYFKNEWMATLDTDTLYLEMQYLSGMTDIATRSAATEQELMWLREKLVANEVLTRKEIVDAINKGGQNG